MNPAVLQVVTHVAEEASPAAAPPSGATDPVLTLLTAMDARLARMERLVEAVVKVPTSSSLSTTEAAHIARRSPDTVRDWVETGALPATKRGRAWVVQRADLDAFLAGRPPGSDAAVDDAVARALGRAGR